MSETLEQPGNEQHVTEEDLRQMLATSTRERDEAIRERDAERQRANQTDAQVIAERNARLLTEQERDVNAGKVVSEAEQKYNAQKEAVKSGITAHEGMLKSAKQNYARHAEMGDWTAAGEAQADIAAAAAELTALRRQENYLETNREKFVQPVVKVAPREVRAAPVAQTDRLNEIITDLLPTERVWLEKRPKFLSDPNYQTSVFDASRLANRKFPRGSEGYIQEIERILGEASEPTTQQQPAARPQERAMSADIAPQRRVAPGREVQGSQEWKLTPDQVEIADGMYGQPNQVDTFIADPAARYKHYYDNRQKLIASGRLPA